MRLTRRSASPCAHVPRDNYLVLLLGGIAIYAICGAGSGFLSLIASNPQARDITFWQLGSFTTAD